MHGHVARRPARQRRHLAPALEKDVATAHELAPGGKLARRRGASLKGWTG
jgi:hypothetical protein